MIPGSAHRRLCPSDQMPYSDAMTPESIATRGPGRHRPRPVVLCVLDGWGERKAAPDNAVALASTPNWDRYKATCPWSRLDASARDVGLPDGQMGNSEVGHMNLGGGRILQHDLPRIDAAIAEGTLGAHPVLVAFLDA